MNAIKSKPVSPCCSRSVMLYADGELDPSHTVEVEAHLKACEQCHASLELVRSMRASLRKSCARRAPSGLDARMREALATCGEGSKSKPVVVEARPSRLSSEGNDGDTRGRRWAVMGAVAVAACFVVVIVLQSKSRQPGLHAVVSGSMVSAAAAANDTSLDTLLDEMVSQHANPLPPEENNPEQLTRLEPFVGVPVRRPALTLLRKDNGSGARFAGARIHRVRESRHAAALQYQLNGHRVTLYVFDPHKIPIAGRRLRPRNPEGSRQLAERPPVYVGNVRGFSIAATERSGIGYAVTSDLDEDNSVQMVASF